MCKQTSSGTPCTPRAAPAGPAQPCVCTPRPTPFSCQLNTVGTPGDLHESSPKSSHPRGKAPIQVLALAIIVIWSPILSHHGLKDGPPSASCMTGLGNSKMHYDFPNPVTWILRVKGFALQMTQITSIECHAFVLKLLVQGHPRTPLRPFQELCKLKLFA